MWKIVGLRNCRSSRAHNGWSPIPPTERCFVAPSVLDHLFCRMHRSPFGIARVLSFVSLSQSLISERFELPSPVSFLTVAYGLELHLGSSSCHRRRSQGRLLAALVTATASSAREGESLRLSKTLWALIVPKAYEHLASILANIRYFTVL